MSKKKLTVKATREGLTQAEKALKRLFVTQLNLANSLAGSVGRSTIQKLFKGEEIQIDKFQEICKALKLESQWEAIANLTDLPDDQPTEPIKKEQDSSINIDTLVQEIPEKEKPYIQVESGNYNESIEGHYTQGDHYQGNTIYYIDQSDVTKPSKPPVESSINIDALVEIDVTTFNEYANRYTALYGSIRILGMKQDASLESIYTKVRFLDELSIRQFISLEALEQTYREGRKRRFQTKELATLDGFTVANKYQYLMVLGGPGAGKSTFLRRIGLEALKGEMSKYQHRSIPVYVELKRLNSDIIDLTKVITEELQNFGFPSSQKFAINFLKQGKLLILLDGLDEVPKANLNAVINAIQDFVTRYDQNRYIASCRIAAHRSTWNRFRDIELADFDDEQIQEFIRNWFQSELDRETGTAEKCWETLNNRSNVAAKELAQTPLLLTFLCMVYDRTQGFPINRARLYKKALDILLEEWAAEKRVYRDEIYQGLNTDLEKVLLSEIAYQGFINDQLFFTQEEIIVQIKAFLADTVDKPKYLDGKTVLDAIAIQQGILVERAEDIFSFSHLTIQEYLTAQYISQDSDYIKDSIEQHLTKERWKEVFLLMAGSVSNADKLIEFMEAESQNYIIEYSQIRKIINWADESTNIFTSHFKPVIRRSVAIALFLVVAKVDNEYVAENSIGVEALLHANSIASLLHRHSLKIHSQIHSLAQALSSFNKDVKALLSIIKYSSNKIIEYKFFDGEKKQILEDDLFESGTINKIFNILKEGIKICIENVESSSDLTGKVAIELRGMINDLAIFCPEIKSSVNEALQSLRSSLLRAGIRQKNLETQVISYYVTEEFVEKIRIKLLKSLNLSLEITNLSEQDIKALKNYLYVNEVIVKCRSEAVRVSRDKWESVQERILTTRRKI